MAKLTLKKSTGLGDLSQGWKTVTINGAKKGRYDNNGTKYIDITFEEYDEKIKLRAHQKFIKATNEEFCIGNIFRYAGAGIQEAQDGVAEIDTKTPSHLIGKKIQVYFFKNAKGYTDISDNVCVAEPMKNIAEEWDEAGIKELKSEQTYRIEKYINEYVKPKANSDSWDAPSSNDSGPPEDNDDWD